MSDTKNEVKELLKGVLMAILIYYVIQGALVMATGVDNPVSVVISGSMDHDGYNFDSWWDMKYTEYDDLGITKEMFDEYKYTNGFAKGDILIITEVDTDSIEIGDIIVFRRANEDIPIVHRVVEKFIYEGAYYYRTKGDHNPVMDNYYTNGVLGVGEDAVVGHVSAVIPKLGNITLLFRGAFGIND